MIDYMYFIVNKIAKLRREEEPDSEPDSEPESDLVQAMVFLVVGQSNAQGSAETVSEIPEGYFDSEMNDVLVDRTEPGNLSTVSSEFDQLPDSFLNSRFGPEVGFAKMLSTAVGNNKIVFIHASSPGTGLSFWNTPGQTGYDTLMNRIDEVQGWLEDLVDTEEIDEVKFSGLIAVNGENEANGNFPETWRSQFEQLVSSVRTKVEEPELPVFVVQLQSDLPQPPAGHADIVRNQQEEWAGDDPNGYLISSDNLYRVDNWHYGSKSMLYLGEKIGASWLINVGEKLVPTIEFLGPQTNRTSDEFVTYSIVWNQPVSTFDLADISTDKISTDGSLQSLNETAPGLEYEVVISGNSLPGIIDIEIPAKSANGKSRSFNKNTKVLHHNNINVEQLLSYDDFGSEQRSLNRLNSGKGWTGQGWISGDYQIINSPPLSYGDLLTSNFFARGGDNFQQSCRVLDLEKTFDFLEPEKSGANPGVFVAGTVLWISYLIRPLSVGARHRVSLSRGNTNTYSDGDNLIRVYQREGNWFVGFRNVNDASGDDTGIQVVSGQTYLVCHKISFGGPSGTNQVSTWIDPDTNTLGGVDLDEATSAITHTNNSDVNFRFSRIKWYPGGGAGDGDLGELRIGTTFASVTPT